MKIRFRCLLPCIVLFSFISFGVRAQNKTLTMEDVVLSARRGLVPEKLDQLQWIPNSNSYSYVKKEADVTGLYTGSVTAKSEKLILTLEQINNSLKSRGKDTLAAFPDLKWEDADRFVMKVNAKVFSYSFKSGKSTLLLDKPADKAANIEINPPHNAMAYTIDNNLWVMTYERRIPVTNDSNINIVNGQIVHREEFGIHKGTFWSPSGKLLAFYRMDQSMVTDYPIIDLNQQPAGVKMVKYPMAGSKSHHVTIGVFNMQNGKTVFLKTGEPAEQYLTNIAWSPDEKTILVAVLNRDQNHLKMNRYNVESGEFESTLFEEKEDAYIQPLNPAVFTKDGSMFIWQSRRDGYNHLYLYEKNGKLVRQLTKGNWEVLEFSGFSGKENIAGFVANVTSPIDRNICTVNIKTSEVRVVTNNSGVHKPMMNSSGEYFIDELSAPGKPRTINIINATGKTEKQLLTASNPLKDFASVKQEIFTIKSDSGDDLYCRLIKPGNFDSTRFYPVIVYVYGGPGINLIINNWTGGADLWQIYMAQRGFIVFTLENRGTPARGKAFEQSTFRKLGDLEMQDQVAGVKFLLNQRYVDKNKMGVFGWSYGGFMSVSMMTRQAGTFRVGVAGGPVIDWGHYEVMYTERYMDTPQENPKGYENSNLLNYVDKLKGKMLLIHGTDDDVVVWQHSLAYLKKAVDKNVQLDYFVYPGHPHNIRGRDRIHLMTKVSNYFFENLR